MTTRLYELGKLLGFHHEHTLFWQAIERLWLLLETAESRGRGHVLFRTPRHTWFIHCTREEKKK